MTGLRFSFVIVTYSFSGFFRFSFFVFVCLRLRYSRLMLDSGDAGFGLVRSGLVSIEERGNAGPSSAEEGLDFPHLA
jgi:hypothetical protein